MKFKYFLFSFSPSVRLSFFLSLLLFLLTFSLSHPFISFYLFSLSFFFTTLSLSLTFLSLYICTYIFLFLSQSLSQYFDRSCRSRNVIKINCLRSNKSFLFLFQFRKGRNDQAWKSQALECPVLYWIGYTKKLAHFKVKDKLKYLKNKQAFCLLLTEGFHVIVSTVSNWHHFEVSDLA